MLNNKARLFGALVVSCCVSAGLQAQDCHQALRGYIFDAESKTPLAYASIFVKSLGRGAITDEHGYYSITDLCDSSEYVLELRHIECAHETHRVRLKENQELNFELRHNAVLHEVLITEKAVAPPPTQAESTVQQVDLAAAKGLGLGETLRKLPGVSLLNSGANVSKPVIQGLHSNRIAIVSDGVTLQSQQWGNDHAPEIDPFTADKITVVKGAAGVRYGVGAMGGAVILEPAALRALPGFNGWVSVGGYSNGAGGVVSGAMDWRPARGNLAFRLQGTAKRSGNLRAPDYWLGNTAALELDFSALAGWKSAHWDHTISVSQFNQDYGILRSAHTGSLEDLRAAIAADTPRNNVNQFSYLLDRPKQRVRHSVLKYRSVYRINDVWKLRGQYSFQYNQRKEYDRGRNGLVSSGNAQISFQLWSNTLDLALEHLPIRHWEGGIGVQSMQQLNYVSRGGFIPDYLGWAGSVWMLERWRRYPMPLEFDIGLRYDYRWNHITTTGNGNNNLDKRLWFGNVSGVAGVLYHVAPKVQVKLNTGYAWRPPAVNELYARGVHQGAGTYEQGNAALQSEKAWNTNLSVDWDLPWLTTNLTLYRNQIQGFIYLNQPKDSIVTTVRGPYPAYFYQQDQVVIRGIDGNFSVKLGRHLSLESQVSLLRGYRLAKTSNQESAVHDWLPLMPADRYQYGIKWTFQEGEKAVGTPSFVRISGTSVQRQIRIPDTGLTKPAPAKYTVLTLDAGHTFNLGKHPLEVGFSVQNLLNTRYRDYLNFFRFYADELGVNVGVRAKWRFGSTL